MTTGAQDRLCPAGSSAPRAEPDLRREGRLVRTIVPALASGVGCALLFSVADGVVAGCSAASFSARTLPLALCLYPPLGLAIGLLLGLLAGGVRAVLLGQGPPLIQRLRRDRAIDLQVAAGLLAAAGALALQAGVVYLFAARVAAAMANRSLAALSTGLVAAGGMVCSGLAFFPLMLLGRPLARRLPRLGAVTFTALALLALALLGTGSLILSRVDWRVIRFGPWVTLSLLGLCIALGTWSLLGRTERGKGRGLLALLFASLVFGLGPALLAPLAGRSQQAVAAAQEGLLLPLLVSVGRALGDRDGDGYSAWLLGGDCDDANPAIHPGAQDIPGNGIDENCIGGDARLPPATAPNRPPAPRSGRPSFSGSILLVCIDTLRADKLGVMGHGGGLTPNLDRLARQGVLFTRAYAQGANTPQSFPSTFTSLYPGRVPFRRRFTGYPEILPQAVTFFEGLAGSGIRTAAVTSHFYFKERRGITQGVKDWDNRDATSLVQSNKDIASPRIVPRAIARLRELAAARQRFILFVHLFEPHSSYMIHPQFPITRRGVEGLEQKYDYEIKFSDLHLGRLLAGLEEAGLQHSTAVIVYSDHAEAFGEHRLYFHGQTLYNEVLHVPLVVRLPAGPVRRVDRPVALLDLAPTLLELMGASVPSSFQGRSLVPLLHGVSPDERRAIGAELMPYPAWPKGQRAMLDGRYKVILRYTENRLEIFDLKLDPKEQRNLADTRPELRSRLQAELARFVEEQMQ